MGRGGNASVYSVEWPTHPNLVIMKVNSDSDALRTTMREASILNDLRGRGGAPRLLGVVPEFHMILMEDYGRHTLADMIRAAHTTCGGDGAWLRVLLVVARRL